MSLKLISHVSGDGDLLEAWLKYYLGLGVSSFHLIAHGSSAENERLHHLRKDYPIHIVDSYEGEFTSEEKKRRIDSVLSMLTDQWLLVVDSDEFVEFPFRRIASTVRLLEFVKGNALYAPMLQHLTLDGSLSTPDVIEDPFSVFPLCSVDLYKQIGSEASINKFPLFYCTSKTRLFDGGNHHPPLGAKPSTSSVLGITHHFKFRSSTLQRIKKRMNSVHTWRHESAQLNKYLESHNYQLPLDGAFIYSRSSMFKRGLLRKLSLHSGVRWINRNLLRY